jgi:hypothetical protein
MSDTTPAAHAAEPQNDSHLTVEDTGSTTDAADLIRDDAGSEAHAAVGAQDDSDVGHVFDQTNGVVEGLDGDSDGTADSDVSSQEERERTIGTANDPAVEGGRGRAGEAELDL